MIYYQATTDFILWGENKGDFILTQKNELLTKTELADRMAKYPYGYEPLFICRVNVNKRDVHTTNGVRLPNEYIHL